MSCEEQQSFLHLIQLWAQLVLQLAKLVSRMIKSPAFKPGNEMWSLETVWVDPTTVVSIKPGNEMWSLETVWVDPTTVVSITVYICQLASWKARNS
jgi:hypothetical protein